MAAQRFHTHHDGGPGLAESAMLDPFIGFHGTSRSRTQRAVGAAARPGSGRSRVQGDDFRRGTILFIWARLVIHLVRYIDISLGHC